MSSLWDEVISVRTLAVPTAQYEIKGRNEFANVMRLRQKLAVDMQQCRDSLKNVSLKKKMLSKIWSSINTDQAPSDPKLQALAARIKDLVNEKYLTIGTPQITNIFALSATQKSAVAEFKQEEEGNIEEEKGLAEYNLRNLEEWDKILQQIYESEDRAKCAIAHAIVSAR